MLLFTAGMTNVDGVIDSDPAGGLNYGDAKERSEQMNDLGHDVPRSAIACR